MAKKKTEKPPREFWKVIVELFDNFCIEKFGESPTFDGSWARDLGGIYDAIKKKTEEKKMEWDEKMATASHRVFFDFCFRDEWLQRNFILFNMNRQKDKIFFTIKSVMDGKRQGRATDSGDTSEQKPVNGYDSKREALSRWGKKTTTGGSE